MSSGANLDEIYFRLMIFFSFRQVFLEFNELALNDDNFATNFALFFSSRTIETVFQMASQVRAEMLNILQQNFMSEFGI